MERDKQIWILMAYLARLNNFLLKFQKERMRDESIHCSLVMLGEAVKVPWASQATTELDEEQ